MTGPHALVTGAAGSLGTELAGLLCEAGFQLSLCDSRQAALESLRSRPRIRECLLASESFDVSCPQGFDAFFARAEALAPVDYLFTVAGVTERAPDASQRQHPCDWPFDTEVWSSNYLGTLVPVLAAARAMGARRRGHLVLVSSMASFFGFPRVPQYAASKAAVRILGESLRPRLAEANIDLSIVCPGFFDSGMSHDKPAPMSISAREAAERTLRGVLRRQSLIVFPRRVYWMSALLAALPGRWQRGVYRRLLG